MNPYPVNQVFLGGDPFPNPNMDIDTQLQTLKAYEEKLKNIRNRNMTVQKQPESTIWKDIDNEISPLTDEQRRVLFSNSDYININNKLQNMVQVELLNLVKGKIESTEEGNKLLNSQLELVKKLKSNIIEESNKEMELFKKFREFSKKNPGVTYEEFIKANM